MILRYCRFPPSPPRRTIVIAFQASQAAGEASFVVSAEDIFVEVVGCTRKGEKDSPPKGATNPRIFARHYDVAPSPCARTCHAFDAIICCHHFLLTTMTMPMVPHGGATHCFPGLHLFRLRQTDQNDSVYVDLASGTEHLPCEWPQNLSLLGSLWLRKIGSPGAFSGWKPQSRRTSFNIFSELQLYCWYWLLSIVPQ